MRKLVLISLLLVCITTETVAETTSQDELLDLASYITTSGRTVDSWEVTIKEEISRSRVDSIINVLKDSYLVTIEEDENSINYSFRNVHKIGEVVESFNVIIPQDERHSVQLIGVLKGVTWNDSIKKTYQTRIEIMHNSFFTKSAKRFACLKTSDGGIIEIGDFLGELIKNYNVQHIKTQYDTVINSSHNKIIYGYIPLWEEKITLMDVPMNLQIAVTENEKGNPTYTIGTPILINEY